MLTDLQQRLIDLITELPEAAPFALAGGAALIVRGAVDRHTEDLDYFAPDAQPVQLLATAVEVAARDAGLAVEVVQAAGSFVRLEIRGAQESCRVDIAHDVRIREPEACSVGSLLSLEELAADKVLALFSRAEARDFVDVQALLERFGWTKLLSLAHEKDLGFDVAHLLDAINAFNRLRPEEFPISEARYLGLREQVTTWRAQLLSYLDD